MFPQATATHLSILLTILTSTISSAHCNPTRTIADVTVIDTPIVRDALAFTRNHSSDITYNHVLRSWLYGVLLTQHNTTYASTDLEVHAVATILHDLGWDPTPSSPLISSDRRFEVDGAIAAREFIRGHEDGKDWEERRVQLVWDSIALHTERTISFYKELEVQTVAKGVGLDFSGPAMGVPKDKYDAVGREFPKAGFKDGLNATYIWLCETKPATTYETWLQPAGERWVKGYAEEVAGKRRIDLIFANL